MIIMSQKKGSKEKNNKKETTIKIKPLNYLYALLIFAGVILITMYIFSWYQVKKEERLMTSYLISSKTIESSINDLESLTQIRQEAPSSYFLYFGYTGDDDVYNFEKSLKRIIDDYKLNDMFYYINLTNLMETNPNYLEEVASNLGIEKLKNVPAIIYVKDGKITKDNILDGINNSKLSIANFEELLDIYEFES